MRMDIQVNGQEQAVGDGINVVELLDELGYGGKRVAVERNGEIVPRSRHGEQRLQSGDQIEIVQAIGGG